MKEEKKKIKLDFIRKMGKSKTYRQNAGITLIALVVTIIILLILAGVTVSLVVGQNGLLQRAQTASNTMANATANEQAMMGEMESEIDRLAQGNGNSEETGGIDWEEIKRTATKHPDQTRTDNIGIDANGNICNLDLWSYGKVDDSDTGVWMGSSNESEYIWRCYNPYDDDIYGGNTYSVEERQKGDLVMPQYIKFSDESSFREVVYLGNDAFLDCAHLRTIVLPSTLLHLGGACFYGCSSLTSLTIPEHVNSCGLGSDNAPNNSGMSGTVYIDSQVCTNFAYSGFYNEEWQEYGLPLVEPDHLQKVCIKSDYYDSEKDSFEWDSVRFVYTTTSNGYAVYERVVDSGE